VALTAGLLQPVVSAAAPGNPASAPRRSRRPIADSVERSVERVLRAHEGPCPYAERDSVPCFPVSLEVEGPRFSVVEALRRYRVTDQRPAPGPPTSAEMFGHMHGPPKGGASFDPVCAVKSLIRSFSGGTNTFYLYRFSDRQGERPLLTDRKLNPEAYASRPDIHYEFLGTFSGECEAIAAWRKALRESRSASETDEEPSPRPGGAPTPVSPEATRPPP
jgi:hypothetical protein